MKLIIAGSRNITDFSLVCKAMSQWLADGNPYPTEVVSGTARGVDQLGERWANISIRPVTVRRFPPDWELRGKAAGPIRNRQMAEYADGLLALWDGRSRGTANMIEEAHKRGLVVHIYRTDAPATDHVTASADETAANGQH